MDIPSGEHRPGRAAQPPALAEDPLRAAFDALPEAVLIVDERGQVQHANSLAHRLLGEELVFGQSAPWSR